MDQTNVYQYKRHLQKRGAALHSAFWSQIGSLQRWLAQCWSQDRKNQTLALPAFLGIGIAAYFYLPAEPSPHAALAFAGITGLAWFAARRNGSWITLALWALACMSLGFGLASLRTFRADTPQVEVIERDIPLIGKVALIETGRKGGQRILLDAVIDGPDGARRLRLRLSTPRLQPGITLGDWVRTRADLKPLPAPVLPGGFDFGRKLWFDGVRGLAFTLQDIDRIEAPEPTGVVDRMSEALRLLRDGITGRILAATSERGGPVAAAFLTGERSGISDDDNEAMQASSLSHLLSISGVHMMLAGFGVFAALRIAAALVPAWANAPHIKKLSAALALVASFAYLLLSGASIPTQRAFLTVAVAFIAVMTDRNAISLRTVALAASAVLMLTPEAWVDPSFQMSFCAVMMLVAAYEWWNRMRPAYWQSDGWVRRISSTIIGTAATSLVAGLATAPFAAYHFNRLSVFGMAANVLVMPLVSFLIMPAGVLALLLMPFGLEWLPLQAMDAGLVGMLDIAHWVASWPYAAVGVPAFSIEALLAMALGLFWLAACQASWRWLGFIPLVIALASAALSSGRDMFVSGSAANMAVRAGDGMLSFASARRARFDSEMWLRADGDMRDTSEALSSRNSVFSCGNGICRARIGWAGPQVAMVNDQARAAEACQLAAIIVVAGEGPVCEPHVRVIDRAALSRSGAISLTITPHGVHIMTVAATRGVRPWVPTP
jgi:competence protein ComEC